MRWACPERGGATAPPLLLLASLLALGVTLAGTALAQDFFGRRGRRALAADPAARVDYDHKLAFVRLRYGTADARWEPPWAHDYPRAERHFMRILKEITFLDVHVDESNVLALDDPDLFNYPIAYMSEPGYWTMSEDEAAALRRYFQKGGFVIFDDFRSEHWYNFEAQMRRVLPEGRLVELGVESPVFHSFFDIKSLDFVQMYDQGLRASFHGIFEDNDPRKRLMLVANYNNDMGEYWEFSDQGFVPIDLSNEAYKFGVNYVVYALTH